MTILSEYVGDVVQGEGKAGIWFDLPTANLHVQALSVPAGSYAALVRIEKKHMDFQAIAYHQPKQEKLECHLFNYNGNLLGKSLHVMLIAKVSEPIPWQNIEHMREKVHQDVKLVRTYFETNHV